MFKKQPYYGWLAVALLLWGLAYYSNRTYHVKLQPANMAAAVAQSLQGRDAQWQALLKDAPLSTALINNKLSPRQQRKISKLPFYIFVYQGNQLIYWNDDNVLPPLEDAPDSVGHLVFVNNQYCLRKNSLLQGKNGVRTLVALLPIMVAYPFENQYLQSHFVDLSYVPAATELVDSPGAYIYPIRSKAGHHWFGLKFPPADNAPLAPDGRTQLAAFAAAIASLLWLQLMLIQLTRRRNWRLGTLLTLLLIGSLWLLVRLAPLPFGIGELPLFSPTIYAYNWLLPSLGNLLFNELALLWVLTFILTETPYKRYFAKLRQPALRWFAAFVIILCFPVVMYQFWTVLNSLVLDSQISFNVSHFHTIDAYTVFGMMAVGLSLINLELVVRLLRGQLMQLIHRFLFRQALVAASCLLFVWLFHAHEPILLVLVGWMMVYLWLLEIPWNRLVGMLSLQMIFLSLFTCACAALILHELVRERDLEKDRIAYASHLLARQDPLMEYNFKSIAPKLLQDASIQGYLMYPSQANKSALTRRLNILYFNILTNRYLPEFYFFNAQGKGLFNADTTSFAKFNEYFDASMPTDDEHLVFNEGAATNNYLAKIPLTTGESLNGYLFISLALKKNINETVYPEILQPATINRLEKDARYAYALYLKGKRISQTNNYNFPATIDTGKRLAAVNTRKIKDDFYELSYRENEDNVVLVAGGTGTWLSAAVLLSYLFGMHLLLSLLALIYRWWLRIWLNDRSTFYHFTLQQRIHFGTLIILLISFVIVGIVTVAFFNDRYIETNSQRMNQTTLMVERSIRQYLAAQGGMVSRETLDSVARTPDSRFALYTLAASQKIDANVYAYTGSLLMASQEDLYEQGLLAPIMRPGPFRQLQAGSDIAAENEQVGNFPFRSSFTPLTNDEGTILGYVSVPFFTYQKELNDQISNIVVALVNLYAVLFFLSSFLAWYISKRLTHAFKVLTNQFSRLNLQKNELLEWPYKDELGLLVDEYNKMALKVEENAAKLAQSERESAWREMARQVAHEIKNPLTPMKLNIQYLQQALRSKRPDVEALAVRVSASIIEQIDNLSYIASEFSNFASMPEAVPEIFELNELLQKVIQLYQGNANIQAKLLLPHKKLHIFADYSQLLRLFTNLMQNAVQAIPDESRAGMIEVQLDEESGFAIVSVADNGVGIDAETAVKIFKPYFTTKSSGTGLGLAMSRKIVELWKGTIWFDSVPGAGTTFYIKLPLENTSPE